MRVKPSLLKGIAVLLGYLAIVFTVWAVTGTDYDTIGDRVENVRNAVTIAMACGVVFIVAVVSALGWWKPALREPRRAAHHRWMFAIPVLLVAGVVLNLAATQWGRFEELGTPLGAYVAWLAVGCAMVGFNEEMITRGQLIVAGRGSLHEGWVWFVTSLLFGLLHVPNAFFGQSVATTVQQVVMAFAIGTAYYVTRRITGLLLIPMILHGAWDFSTFVQDHSVGGMASRPVSFGGFAMYVVIPLALVAVWRLHHDEGDVVEPGGDQLAAFEAAA